MRVFGFDSQPVESSGTGDFFFFFFFRQRSFSQLHNNLLFGNRYKLIFKEKESESLVLRN